MLVSMDLLLQTFLVWQLALSTLILGRKYSFNQILGCFLVAAGVVTAVARYLNSFSSNFWTSAVTFSMSMNFTHLFPYYVEGLRGQSKS